MAKDLQFTFKRPCLELSGEIGSLAELIGYMQEESTGLTHVFGDDMELVVQRISNTGGPAAAPAPANDQAGVAPAEAKKRGRPAKATVEAVAPDPLPVPSAVPAAPALPTTEAPSVAPALPTPATALPPPPSPVAPPLPAGPSPADQVAASNGGIPDFLRNQAPPPVVAPPPVGVLGPKVVKALDEHAKGKPDGGQALSDWLAASGLTIKGKSYDEACRAVLMISDQKIIESGVAAALGVTA